MSTKQAAEDIAARVAEECEKLRARNEQLQEALTNEQDRLKRQTALSVRLKDRYDEACDKYTKVCNESFEESERLRKTCARLRSLLRIWLNWWESEKIWVPENLLDLAEETKAALKAEGGSANWIKCSERLPKDEQAVLFCWERVARKGIFYACGDVFQPEFWSEHGASYEVSAVTHWMPLPELPKVAA